MQQILLAGSAGFIGQKVAEFLLKEGYEVIGVDNFDDYYDLRLKEYRLSLLKGYKNFFFHRVDIRDYNSLKSLFERYRFSAIINLAARAGVRDSVKDPFIYFSANLTGNLNLLELSKEFKIEKFVLASTSSLYAGQKLPFKESLSVNTPISPYAASKKSAELSCYTYHYLYGIDITILRYFTVYGPAGRPDMSIFRFIKWIDEGNEVIVYGDGRQKRDFTYIDDIAEGTIKGLKRMGFKIINLGNSKPYELNYVIGVIENYLSKKAKIVKQPFHKADFKISWADIEEAGNSLGWKPKVDLGEGIRRTVAWYKQNRKWVSKVEVEKK
ncbi:MAG: nucleotide sugar epimerase [Candidatus Omnitrophota bacterium]|nr:MAG: nucleotide sugar epimerase [Candidatus Omnitrophota bacterium]